MLQIINSFPKENISSEQLEEMLEQLGKYLTSSHWMVMEIKQKLVDLYISAKVVTCTTIILSSPVPRT